MSDSSRSSKETGNPTPPQASEATDRVEHPHAHYEHPEEVVVDPLLSKEEKLRALEAMEQDAKQLSTAAAEGMAGDQGSGLHEVLDAKQALEMPPFDLAVSVVLQGLRARLSSTEGTEAHALIARAIESLDAATGVLDVH